jgi:hypothetical protein
VLVYKIVNTSSCDNINIPHCCHTMSLGATGRAHFDAVAKDRVVRWREQSVDRAQLVDDEWFGSTSGAAASASAASDAVPTTASAACDILPGVPMPFTRDVVDDAYVVTLCILLHGAHALCTLCVSFFTSHNRVVQFLSVLLLYISHERD